MILDFPRGLQRYLDEYPTKRFRRRLALTARSIPLYWEGYTHVSASMEKWIETDGGMGC